MCIVKKRRENGSIEKNDNYIQMECCLVVTDTEATKRSTESWRDTRSNRFLYQPIGKQYHPIKFILTTL